MARLFWIAATMLAFATLASAKAPKASDALLSPKGIEAEAKALDHAFDQMRNNNPRAAYAELKAVVAAPTFAELSSESRHDALLQLAISADEIDDEDTAYSAVKQSSVMEEATGLDWHVRLSVASQLDNVRDAASCIAAIARRWPESLPQINDMAIYRLHFRLRSAPEDRAQWFEMMQGLFDAHWTPTRPFDDASTLWVDLALERLARGEAQGAAAVAERITEPTAIMSMRADKRFDALTQSDPARFDVVAAANRALAEVREKRALHGDLLAGVNAEVGLLMLLDRNLEALKLLDETLAKALPEGGGVSPYTDMELQLVWTMNARAEVLDDLGRHDEAVQQMTRGARRPEQGHVNVSQVINLGDELYMLGHAREALDTVADVSGRDTSPFGAMAAMEVRVCAYAQLGDKARLAESLDFMRKHAADAEGPLKSALLCAGDLDGAAAQLIHGLEDPQTRSDLLLQLQVYDLESKAKPPFARLLKEREDAVLARPEVKAAIDRVGRIEHYPLNNPHA